MHATGPFGLPLVFVVAVLVVAVIGLALVVRWMRGAGRSPYRAVPLFSPAEAEFYHGLVEIYGTSAIICPKVRLLDLIRPQQGLDKSTYQTAFNRVAKKHVDFVILRPEDLSVLGVIELDDRSHERQDRADRDMFVDDALQQSGIPVCRVKCRRQYDLDLLATQLHAAFFAEPLPQPGA